MRKIILLIGFLLFGAGLHAQITPLQEAVDFTVIDVQGQEHNLFEILDGGQAVFIHIFLTWRNSNPTKKGSSFPQPIIPTGSIGLTPIEAWYDVS